MTVKGLLSTVLIFGFCVAAQGEDGPSGASPGMERGGILAHTRTQKDLKKKKAKAKKKKAAAAAAAAKSSTTPPSVPAKTTDTRYEVQDGSPMGQPVQEEATPKPNARRWTVDIYYEDYYFMSDADHNTGMMYTDGYLGTTYTVNKNLRLYIRQNYNLNIDRSREQEFEYNGELSDTEFGFYRDNIFTWAGGGSFNAYTRFYVSTGYHQWSADAAQHSGQIFRFRPMFITSQPIGKYLEVGHVIDPRIMANQRKGQVVDDGTGKLIAQTNALYKLAEYFYFTAHKDKTSGTFILGTYDYWYNKFGDVDSSGSGAPTGTDLPTHKSYIYTDISATVQVVKEVAITAGVENDLRTDSHHPYEFSWLRERETLYYLNMFIRI